MGQEYWLEYKSDTKRKKIKKHLTLHLEAADDKRDKSLYAKSKRAEVDCWLSWKGARLEIASQVFNTQSAWCAAVALRIMELFGEADRVGADSTGWWPKGPKGELFGKPFEDTIKGLGDDSRFKQEVAMRKRMQRLYIKEAARLLPEPKGA